MPLGMEVRNQVHETIRMVGDDKFNPDELIKEVPRDSLLWGVDPYADTIFNCRQLKIIIQEMPRLRQDIPGHKETLQIIEMVAEEAIRARGYIVFIGD